MTLLCVSLILAVTTTAPESRAAEVGNGRSGVVLSAEAGVDPGLLAAVNDFFTQADAYYASTVLLIGEGTRKPLRRRIAKCEGALPCVAKIGRNNNLREVVLARGTPRGEGGARWVFTVISVETRTVVREYTLELPSVASVQAELARVYFDVVGITTPGFIAIAHAPATVDVDGVAVPYGSGPLALKPGPHTVRVGEEEQPVMILPGDTRKLTFASLTAPVAVAEPAAPADEVAAAPAAQRTPAGGKPDLSLTRAAPASGSRLPPHALAWAGMGAVGVGVALVAVGTYFGSQTTVSLSPDTSQAEAKRRNRSATTAAARANLFFGLGGGFFAIGGATWAVDRYVLGRTVAVSVAPTDGGAALRLAGTF